MSRTVSLLSERHVMTGKPIRPLLVSHAPTGELYSLASTVPEIYFNAERV